MSATESVTEDALYDQAVRAVAERALKELAMAKRERWKPYSSIMARADAWELVNRDLPEDLR